MVKLTSTQQALALRGRIPDLATKRMAQFEGSDGIYDPEDHGYLIVLEQGDDIEQDFPMVGNYGLLTYLDDEWQAPFEFVGYVVERGRRIFEATIPLVGDAMLALFVPDEPWVDPRLLLVLDVSAEKMDAS